MGRYLTQIGYCFSYPLLHLFIFFSPTWPYKLSPKHFLPILVHLSSNMHTYLDLFHPTWPSELLQRCLHCFSIDLCSPGSFYPSNWNVASLKCFFFSYLSKIITQLQDSLYIFSCLIFYKTFNCYLKSSYLYTYLLFSCN